MRSTAATRRIASSLSPPSSKLTALPFLLSSADALNAARTCATTSAHWDERGTLEGFAPYTILSRLGITPFFSIGKRFEDELVTCEQSAAVYLPTWIIDASLSFTANATDQQAQHPSARTVLLLEHARFPGSTWSPISSLPLWPTNNLFNAQSSSSIFDFPNSSSSQASAEFADSNVPEYEEWDPESHLSIGRAQNYLDDETHQIVDIEGPITALPFELTPLALPAFLKSFITSSSSQDHFTLSTRQPPTTSEMVILIRNFQHELRSVSEAEKIDGIELNTSAQNGPLNIIKKSLATLFGLKSASSSSTDGMSPSEAKAQRLREKKKEEDVEKRKEREVKLDPGSLEVDMLAAYPVMLPMHILKFSYQPKVSLTSSTSSTPPRKSITVAVAAWDPTATHILRTLPPTCTWSSWGTPTDSVMGYDSNLPSDRKPEPPSSLRFSPLNVGRMEMIPAAPVRVPEGAEALEESLGEASEAFFGVNGSGGSAREGVRLHAESLLALSSPSSTPEEDRTAQRDQLALHLLRHAYKTLVVQLLQSSLVRRASAWLNRADGDAGEEEGKGEIGWRSYREFQDGMLEEGEKEDQRTPGLVLTSTSTASPQPSIVEKETAEEDEDEDMDEDEDPALPNPSLLQPIHVQPFNKAALPNRKYLAALAQRTRADVMHALAESGDAVVFLPVKPEEGEGEEGSRTSVEDVLSGAGQMKLADGADARKATAKQVDYFSKIADESKPEWLRTLHESAGVASTKKE
ncbi:hypothetical protein CF326_g8615 [Tilletia indica]|nr:hypothetical protein CF326_g8615 [Tilletia indica]